MLTRRRRTTRFRCGHCGNRLIMHDRHLCRLVACHGCGKATHPVARRLGGGVTRPRQVPVTLIATEVSPRRPAPPRIAATAPAAANRPVTRPAVSKPRTIELTVAPLAPALLIGAAGLGFFAAVSLMSSIGGIASALFCVLVTAAAVRGARRGVTSVRSRLEQIEALRLRHGTLGVVKMLAAWLRSQPMSRLPWAILLTAVWMAIYIPFRVIRSAPRTTRSIAIAR